MEISIIAPANATVSFALDYVRPALSGSEKQIAWAEKIRAKREDEIAALLRDEVVAALKVPHRIIFSDDADRIEAARAVIDRALSIVGHVLDRVFGEAKAATWIDQRGLIMSDLIRGAR